MDFVVFLNELPIVDLELKHERDQAVDDAADQYVGHDHAKKIFKHPFACIAADTTEVKVATGPRTCDGRRPKIVQ